MASVPATSAANPANISTPELTPASGEPLADPGRRQDAVAGLRDMRTYPPEDPAGNLQRTRLTVAADDGDAFHRPARSPFSDRRYLLYPDPAWQDLPRAPPNMLLTAPGWTLAAAPGYTATTGSPTSRSPTSSSRPSRRARGTRSFPSSCPGRGLGGGPVPESRVTHLTALPLPGPGSGAASPGSHSRPGHTTFTPSRVMVTLTAGAPPGTGPGSPGTLPCGPPPPGAGRTCPAGRPPRQVPGRPACQNSRDCHKRPVFRRLPDRRDRHPEQRGELGLCQPGRRACARRAPTTAAPAAPPVRAAGRGADRDAQAGVRARSPRQRPVREQCPQCLPARGACRSRFPWPAPHRTEPGRPGLSVPSAIMSRTRPATVSYLCGATYPASWPRDGNPRPRDPAVPQPPRPPRPCRPWPSKPTVTSCRPPGRAAPSTAVACGFAFSHASAAFPRPCPRRQLTPHPALPGAVPSHFPPVHGASATGGLEGTRTCDHSICSRLVRRIGRRQFLHSAVIG